MNGNKENKSDLEKEKQKYALDKLNAETNRIRLETKLLETKLAGKEKPSKWEIARVLITWFGILIPASISIFTYLNQREAELIQRQKEFDQQQQEARERRMQEIIAIQNSMTKQNRASGIMQLTMYGSDAVPILLGEIKTEPSEHANSYQFPDVTLAAVGALKRLKNILTEDDLAFLRAQADLTISKWDSTRFDRSGYSFYGPGVISIITAIQDLAGEERRWIEKLELLTQEIKEVEQYEYERESNQQKKFSKGIFEKKEAVY